MLNSLHPNVDEEEKLILLGDILPLDCKHFDSFDPIMMVYFRSIQNDESKLQQQQKKNHCYSLYSNRSLYFFSHHKNLSITPQKKGIQSKRGKNEHCDISGP